jgi:adenosylcobinamide-phosphate synthase
VQLGGVNVYFGRTEDRHTLGDGRAVAPADVARATRLALLVDVGALLSCVLVPRLLRRRRR